VLLTLRIDFFTYDFPMTQLAQTNNPIATKNTKRALCVCDHQQSAYRRCGLLACKIIFYRKPVRGAYKRPGDYRMRGGFKSVFIHVHLRFNLMVCFFEQKATKGTKILK
ncbi:MAG: hypothetical protein LBM04_09880, partial [Opitutaceae bacterium]|nr:hypothetical protein [Opitutaceae bacterium]